MRGEATKKVKPLYEDGFKHENATKQKAKCHRELDSSELNRMKDCQPDTPYFRQNYRGNTDARSV